VSRLLLLSASMGSGHDAVAAELARRLQAAGHHTRCRDVLAMLPGGLGPGVRRFYRTVVERAPAVYAGIYAAFFRGGAGPRPGSSPLAALAERRLLAELEDGGADAVVPVFHLAAQLTGRMRAAGRLPVPSAVVVTDFALHRQWQHPGNDLHLCLTPRIADDLRRRWGLRSAVCGPLLPDRFRPHPPGERSWRHRLARRSTRPPVVLAAGAWGVGSRLDATARWVRSGGYLPVILCGRNERLRRAAARVPDALALGWVDDMPGLLAASRALVDNAAGQTALEALAVGSPVVGYRPIPGHGADGVRAMAALGLTSYAAGPWQLLQHLDRLTPQVRAAGGGAGAGLPRGDVVGHLERLIGEEPGRRLKAGGPV
jgi:UDP-N-acetylglucosamine:LPS N-acetylglucosamine transferase